MAFLYDLCAVVGAYVLGLALVGLLAFAAGALAARAEARRPIVIPIESRRRQPGDGRPAA